jgi:hypothetical protein
MKMNNIHKLKPPPIVTAFIVDAALVAFLKSLGIDRDIVINVAAIVAALIFILLEVLENNDDNGGDDSDDDDGGDEIPVENK